MSYALEQARTYAHTQLAFYREARAKARPRRFLQDRLIDEFAARLRAASDAELLQAYRNAFGDDEHVRILEGAA